VRRLFILTAALLGAGLVWPRESCADDRPEPLRIPNGKGEIQLQLGEVKLKVFTYRPKDFDPKDGPMLWTFHGRARDPEHYRDAAEEVARHCKGIVLAPLFDETQFPGEKYMHGNVLARGKALPESEWTFSLVPRMIEEVRKMEGRPNMPYYLFGHSGGGQFVMRLMAFVELQPVEVVAANPGSLLFPTTDLPYPYGFGQLPGELGGEKRIKAFLAARLTLYSGTADTDPKHPELDRSAEAEKQGPHRLARAQNAFAVAQKVATAEGWKCEWRQVEAPDVGHNGPGMLRHAKCLVALFDRQK
jgi:poly(3-hydroxybutyrate) depolymerase